jgi:RNA polymerase sigma-70 factor (ECF subfamily)
MPKTDPAIGTALAGTGHFVTTHWSLVLAASDLSTPEAEQALGLLCRAYWYPLYAFTRRRGYAPEDAQDLTQGFFAHLFEKRSLGLADPKRGRFRSFLLASLKNYLANDWDKRLTAKRGGAHPHVSFDEFLAEQRYGNEPRQPAAPETLFDQAWALALLEQALGKLRAEFVAAGKQPLFDQLKPALTGQRTPLSYAELAVRFAISEGAVKVIVHRMRQRFGELIRAEIVQTVADPADVDEEMRYFISVLAQ